MEENLENQNNKTTRDYFTELVEVMSVRPDVELFFTLNQESYERMCYVCDLADYLTENMPSLVEFVLDPIYSNMKDGSGLIILHIPKLLYWPNDPGPERELYQYVDTVIFTPDDDGQQAVQLGVSDLWIPKRKLP